MDVYAMFNRFVPTGKLLANTIIDQYGEHKNINCSNRYFSSRKDHPYAKHIPFSRDVDPKGILTRAVGGVYLHTEDNIVWYYERSEGSNGAIKYVTLNHTIILEIMVANRSLQIWPHRTCLISRRRRC